MLESGAVSRTPRHARRVAPLALAAALLAGPAGAAPSQYLTVGDPPEDELRILDLFPRGGLQSRLRLQHLGSRPLQLFELQGSMPPVATPRPEMAIALARVERVLGRDPTPEFVPSAADPVTPRLFQRSQPRIFTV